MNSGFKERKGLRVAGKGNVGMAIVNCVVPCIYVSVETNGSTKTSKATCIESTNGQAITIDPKGEICLNTGCSKHITLTKER